MLSNGTEMVFSSPGLRTSFTFMVSMAKPCSALNMLTTLKLSGFEPRFLILRLTVLPLPAVVVGPLAFQILEPCSSVATKRTSSCAGLLIDAEFRSVVGAVSVESRRP